MEGSESEWIEVNQNSFISGCGRKVAIPMTVKNTHTKPRNFRILVSETFEQKEELIEWNISVETPKTYEISTSPVDPKNLSVEFSVPGDSSLTVRMIVTTPRGGFNGDRINIKYSVQSEDDLNSTGGVVTVELKPVFIAAKTTVGGELQVSIDLYNKSIKDFEERQHSGVTNPQKEVISIISPKEVRGYIFVETMHPDRVETIAKGIKGFKGIVEGDIRFEEISHYLTPKPAVTGLELGSFVELIDGPFKGEKAKIMSIDKGKEEVTVQLIEAMIPIPVTVRAEALRVLDKR
ncbi:MAG: transcription elongation factor Spt5 [Candidatus Thermoplasmatota archaeon]|nr:transcription elongation factor Spt5 [Candidatus Thermoplasmatota archaeon]MCL5731446.1 transcription elongation factor Spt5 [Candidatus Thermoplasmatota archaeon]